MHYILEHLYILNIPKILDILETLDFLEIQIFWDNCHGWNSSKSYSELFGGEWNSFNRFLFIGVKGGWWIKPSCYHCICLLNFRNFPLYFIQLFFLYVDVLCLFRSLIIEWFFFSLISFTIKSSFSVCAWICSSMSSAGLDNAVWFSPHLVILCFSVGCFRCPLFFKF